MALNPLELDTVSRGFQTAKKILDELKPVIDSLNVIYDSAGGVKETISQEELDDIPAFSGITKAQLDDGMFALTSTLREDINNAFTQLTHLAARAG